MSGDLAGDLREETLKWLDRAENLLRNLAGDERFLENISAYLSDSKYFLEMGDLIRAFEAVVWAWAWMEIGLEIELLRSRNKEEENQKIE